MTLETDLLHDMFLAAVKSAMPNSDLARFLPSDMPKGRIVVVGAGKASAAMASALEQAWDGPLSGLVLTPYGHLAPCTQITIVQAAHPVPDLAGQAAAQDILDLASGLGKDDLLVALISGGGSSLLALPCPGLSLADKQSINSALLRSGANISQMNTVRKHLSAIKGGRLAAAAYPATTLTLAISDVPGDDPSVIASGPTVGDNSTLADARAILAKILPDIPAHVSEALNNPDNETPDATDPSLARSTVHIIATPMAALKAAAAVAEAANIPPVILGDAIEGEAADVGKAMAQTALAIKSGSHHIKPPCVLISGGETTVTLQGDGPFGRGGRNVEFLLGLAQELDNAAGIYALACDTDGVDGVEMVAGATVTPDTAARAKALNYPIEKALANHDGHGFFGLLQDAIVTGPTCTNVNDFRAILVT